MLMIDLATSLPFDGNGLRVLQGSLRVMSRLNEYLYNVELELLDERVNANKWQYANLDKHRAAFAGIPILIAYVQGQGGTQIGDGHNMRERRDRNGETFMSFTDADSERIIGSLSDDEADIRLENRNGNRWIIGNGTIWAWYAREAVEKIAEQGRMSISIETLVTENRMEGDVEIEESYVPLGVTILGDGVPPAVRGANIRPNMKSFREMKLRAASFAPKPTESNTTTKGVRKMNNKRMEKLRSLFPDHDILTVSEDGRTVALMNRSNGELSGHCFAEGMEDVVLENGALDVENSIDIHLSNGTKIAVDYDAVLGKYAALADKAARKLAEVEKTLDASESRVKELESAERKRRISAAKEAVKNELKDINDMLDNEGAEALDDSACNEVIQEIENGDYSEMVDENGEWCGAERACAALKARCMDRMKRNSAKHRKPTTYVWSSNESTEHVDESNYVSAILAHMKVSNK